MEKKKCYYCGTEYPLEDACCPICEQTEIEPEAIDEAPAEIMEDTAPAVSAKADRVEKKQKRANVISTIVCILLGIAVVAGVLFILNTLGVISFDKAPANETSLTLPVEDPTPADVLCTGVDVAPATTEFIAEGNTIALAVTVSPVNCTEKILFASSDETVATVTDTGVVTCVANGTAEITVTCGEFAKSVQVTCTIEDETEDETTVPEEEMNPVLSSVDFTLFETGETAKLYVTGIAEDATVEWTSSNPAVASVEDGTVTALGRGTATISAKIGDVTLKCIVRCNLPESAAPVITPDNTENNTGNTDIIISHDDVTIAFGESFLVRLVQDNARVQGVSWTTSNESVCTVEQNGTVVGRGTGTATVTGTYNGMTYRCIVRCG